MENTCSCNKKSKHDDHWFKHFWRPWAAAIYMFICLMDFAIMPVAIEVLTERDTRLHTIIEEVQKIDNEKVQIALINKANVEARVWAPLTLMGGGLFHVAFGAILTGAAVTRGLERKAQAEKGML